MDIYPQFLKILGAVNTFTYFQVNTRNTMCLLTAQTEQLEEKETMLMLVIGRTNKNGFTLIELLVVLVIIGIASSYILLNTSVLNFIKLRDHSIENSFQLLSEESILRGKTIYWYASKAEQKFYTLNQNNQALEVIEIDGLSLLDNYSDQTVIRVKTANGGQYELDTDISETPLISFYPSGQNSGAIIDINDNEQLIKIVISQNGFISTKINSQ